jgi:hypothetical protein
MRAEIRQGFYDTSTQLDGLNNILVMLAASLHHHDERIEWLEGKPDD